MIHLVLIVLLLAQAGPIPPQAPMKENRTPVPAPPAQLNQAHRAMSIACSPSRSCKAATLKSILRAGRIKRD